MNELGILRNVRDDEVELIRRWRNAPAVRANMYTRHEIGVEEHQAWWASTRQRSDRRYFMYEHAAVAVGVVSFSGIDLHNSNCSWAFYAAPTAAKGTGTRMEYLALEHVFGELALHKLCCEVLAFNEPVLKLHQKFGFRVEGIFHEQHRGEAGFVDIHRLGLLRREWFELRAGMLERILRIAKGSA